MMYICGQKCEKMMIERGVLPLRGIRKEQQPILLTFKTKVCMKKIYLLMFALLGMGLANLYAQVGYVFDSASNGDFAKAFDGDTHTKFEGNNLAGNWIIVKTSDETAQVVKSYAISTHDDGSYNNRAPKTWRVEGSNDKTNWSTIAEVLSGDPIENKNYTTFPFDDMCSGQAFTYVKFTMLSMKSTGWTQISEFAVMGVAPAEVDAFRSAMQTKYENKINAAQDGVMDIFDEMGSSDPLYTDYKTLTDGLTPLLSGCAASYDYYPIAAQLAKAADLYAIYDAFAGGANAYALDGSACWGDGHYSQLVDGKDGVADGKGTKWGGDFSGNEGDPQHVQYVIFRLKESLQPYFYKLVTGGDTKKEKNRNWKDWTVYGGNFSSMSEATKDAAGWVALDIRTDISEQYLPMENNYPAALNFTEGVSEPYLFYMVKVTKAHEGGKIQMNEMYLLTQPEFEATRAPLVAYFDDFDSSRDVTDLTLEDKREQFVAKFATLKTTSDPVLMTLTYNELVALRAELEADMDYTQFQDEVTAVDGVYQLGTPAELKLFGKVVNFGHPDLKAALTADIDMAGIKMNPIGTNTVHYTGTFDGQGQTISNYSFSNAGESGVGLFGYIEGATIKNVVLSAANIEGRANAGGLVGNAQNSTVEHNQVIGSTITGYDHVAAIVANAVDNTRVKFNYSNSDIISTRYQAGGVCGTVKAATIEGNLFTGTVSNPNGTAGGLIALIDADDANPTIKNNLVAASTVTGTNTYTIVNTVDRAASFADNFILATTVYSTGAKVVNNKDDQNGCQVSAEEIAGGKFAYVMNGDQSVIAWYQNIGADAYPTLDQNHMQVYKEGEYYTNVEGLPFENGVAIIENAAQLVKFSEYVNAGNFKVNGKLTADIDMKSIDNFTPIGKFGNGADDKFYGNFDGQNHKISNLTINFPDNDAVGLFNTGHDNECVVIQNLWLDETCTITGKASVGLIGNHNHGAAVFSNLGNAGTVSGGDNYASLVGRAWSQSSNTVDLENCWSVGKVNGTKNSCASLIGWASGSCKYNLTNCWIATDVQTPNADSRYLVRYASTPTFKNCYSTKGTQAGVTVVDNADLASGKLAYELNKAAGKNLFFQTIGTETYPTTFGAGIVAPITEAGYATFYDETSDMEIGGAEVYTGKINGETLKLTQEAQTIPAGTPVILKGDKFFSYAPTTGAAAVSDSDLKGTATDLAADGTQYVLAKKDDVVGFYQATDGTIAAGKAYILYAGGGVKGFTFGTADGIASPLSETEEGAVIYDLSGRRVEKATKGIYIINGKKVLK